MSQQNILWQLSDMSGVDANVLAESEDLFTLVQTGKTIDDLLAWVKENFSVTKTL